ncbi:MAG: vitamin B12 transporter [Saprospiraceae bacterium]|jgi:vitamin B12 transporter
MIFQKYLTFLSFLILSFCVNAQIDTTIVLEEIEVKSTSIRQQSVGANAEKWDVTDLKSVGSNNIAELLSTESGVFIKSYGLGSLSTSSLRGGSAGHTLILWNGLPLQSPMLGLLDLSLLPVNSSEEVTLQKGGKSAAWGSGAIGGLISLNNKPDFSNKSSLNSSLAIGSFGYLQQQFQYGFGNKRFQSRTKIFSQQAQNDFPYFIAENQPDRKQSNAQLSQQNIMQNLYWKLKSNQQISVHLWQQNSDRQIPPTNVQNSSVARQDDRSFRGVIDWKQIRENSILQAKGGLVKEDLDYFDADRLLESRSEFETLFGEFTTQFAFENNTIFHVGMTHFYTTAKSEGYQNAPSESKTALFISYQLEWEKCQIQASLREELVNGQFIPLTPDLGVNIQLLPRLQFKGKVSRNYRLPTLNDRFWRPGGNENLLPESGWSEELTLSMDLIKSKKAQANFSLTGFNRTIENWIWWSKKEGQNYWSAQNIAEVWSRGVEARLSISYQLNDWKVSLKSGYDLIRSTNKIAIENPQIAAGSQLFYTPRHHFFANGRVEWKTFSLAYQQQFSGATEGINEDLPSYFYANFRLQNNFNKNDINGSIFLTINNLWDTDYFIIERRPMPGRHFQIGINFSFNQKI